MLSIIMYVENNLPTINLALQGVLNPIPINYEIILIDASTDGRRKIDGIPDKKFSVKVDAAFKELNTIAELNLTAQQKLTALGSNGINGLVGTKFFKRKFLEENHIRFNEGEGVDAELAFVVNAFMATEKITFVPQLFYGRLKRIKNLECRM